MNFIFLIIVVVASVTVITSVSFFALPDNRLHCTFCSEQSGVGQAQLLDITTEPQIVTIGNPFLIYANVWNTDQYPILFNDGCVSPLTVHFDRNVQIQSEIGCYAISNQIVNPGQQTRIHGPSSGVLYNATSLGTTNATLIFSYQEQGKTYNVTFYKQITIESPSSTPSSNLAEQLGLAQSSNINPLGVTALVIYNPPDACLGFSCPPYTFYLKMNANSTAYLIGYDICGNDLCVKNNTMSIPLPLNNIMMPNYATIGISENKKWNYGDAVDIRLEISPSQDNKTAYFLDIKNSTIVP
jgi:hypothetical protein